MAIPNANHTSGGDYGDHKRFDFFVRYLRGVEPPAWGAVKVPKPATPARTAASARTSVVDEDALPWIAAEDWK